MSNRRGKQMDRHRQRVVYKTPGRECQHADSGCCPACFHGPRLHLRFTSRQPMPTAR